MGHQQGRDHERWKKLAALTVVGVLAVALLVWLASSFWRGGNDRRLQASSSGTATEQSAAPMEASEIVAAGVAPVEISPALVAEYYEHDPEHAPPRDPSGSMQRRERDYVAPPNPFPLVRQKLTHEPRDQRLRQWLDAYEAELLGRAPEGSASGSAQPRVVDQSGRPQLSGSLNPALREALSGCSLYAHTLLDAGRAFQFLGGEHLAADWYRAGFEKAEEQFKDTPPGDPSARPILALAEQTGKAMWRGNHWDVQERRFRLARRLYPPLSPEARRNGVLLGVSLFYQGKAKEAADAILEAQAEHDRAGDLGQLERSDLDEMAWLQGLFLYQAGRHSEALPHFKRCAELGMNWSRHASRMVQQIESSERRRSGEEQPARSSTGG